MRYMTTVFAKENQGAPPKALIDAIGRLGMEAGQAGVFVQMGGLLSTASGGRIRQSGGKLTVTDGPFAEAKEVIGGFAIYELASKAEAMAWAMRFMKLHVEHWPAWEGECEVRAMYTEGAGPETR
ncbi:MAG TPA: YciI family protein [Vicinamibacterales bacterium]|nr:YciI family protein [Vicinamibacterales bacterium]